MEELRVGATLSGWSPVVWIPMKGIPRAVKPREEGSTPNNIKPYETRTPNTELATDRALIPIDSWIWMFKKF
jgi:hypothetical protein